MFAPRQYSRIAHSEFSPRTASVCAYWALADDQEEGSDYIFLQRVADDEKKDEQKPELVADAPGNHPT